MGGESRGPVAAATATLLDWLATAGVPAQVAHPGGEPGGAGEQLPVRVWPLALQAEQAVHHPGGRRPLRLRVRYLIAVDPAAAQATALLDRLLVASLADGAVDIIAEPVTVDIWRAFGLTPRLGLFADVPTQATRPEAAVARARAPMRIGSEALARVQGQVLGPGRTPVPGIRVVALGTGAATYTDNGGRFAFAALPAGGPARLLLSGKGMEFVAELATASDEPVVIHCDMEED